MKLSTLGSVRVYSAGGDAALALLRLIVGLAFMHHGWSKIHHPFTWMGANAFAPAPFQALAAVSEYLGGAALILGLATPLAAFGIACTMTVAFFTHAIKRGDPFVSSGGGPSFELALVYFTIAVAILSLGPGRFSLDRKFFGER